MGLLYYSGGTDPIQIEDRALAHLKVVIATKLRRNESFTLSWRHAEGHEPGRSTIWLHPSIPLRFVFADPLPPALNLEWITALANSANSSGGITLIDESLEAIEHPSGDRSADRSGDLPTDPSGGWSADLPADTSA